MCLSVRLFVCPTLVFWCQKSRRNSNWVMPYGGTKCRWVMFKLATFDQHLTITRKRCKIGINYCNTVLAGAPRKDKLQITNLEKKKWTNYSVCCTLLRVSSPALESLTEAWVRYCTTNFTGSTSPTGCFSSWQ